MDNPDTRPGDLPVIYRLIARRIENARRTLAAIPARWADYRTPPLTGEEWIDLANRFPKIYKLYVRGILTMGETARTYRSELAWSKVA